MYSPVVDSLDKCYEVIRMLNDVLEYKSNRFIITVKECTNCFYYGFWDTYGVYSKEEKKVYRSAESIIEYLESIEVVKTEIVEYEV